MIYHTPNTFLAERITSTKSHLDRIDSHTDIHIGFNLL